MKIIITGVLGFIFTNFIQFATWKYPDYQFVGIDLAVKDYNLDNMHTAPNYKFYLADIANAHQMQRIFEIEKPDIVINGAAESFVDNSITDVMPFLHTNIIGTQCLINECLKYKTKFIHCSTDEVYGQQLERYNRPWTEASPLEPRNPYAASKGAAELIVRSANATHGLSYQMTRSCNVFGPRQKKENLVPMIINNLIDKKPITIHGDGQNFRQYIYVQDEVNTILKIMEKGELNTEYNIGDNNIFTNLEMVNYIAEEMKIKPNIQFITDRKAHDKGYKVDFTKLNQLGLRHMYKFNEGIRRTIDFYTMNTPYNSLFNHSLFNQRNKAR